MLATLYKFIQEWLYDRKIRKAEKETEFVADSFVELYRLATTFHGRYNLSRIIEAADEGDLDIDPNVLHMYRFLLVFTPFQMYAILN